jgi:hypothetical protein
VYIITTVSGSSDGYHLPLLVFLKECLSCRLLYLFSSRSSSATASMNPDWQFPTQPYDIGPRFSAHNCNLSGDPTEGSSCHEPSGSSDWMDQTLGALSNVLASYGDENSPNEDWNSPGYIFDFGSSDGAHCQFGSSGIQSMDHMLSAPVANVDPIKWSFSLDTATNDYSSYAGNWLTEPNHEHKDKNGAHDNRSRVLREQRRMTTYGKRRKRCKSKDTPPASKSRRSHISPSAKTLLEIQFLQEPYPKDDVIAALAMQTGLDKRTIKTWFCNTRSRGLVITCK